MFGLGVLADHHVFMSLLITRQRGLFWLLVCRGTPFLLRCGCLLSLYPSWYAPSGPTQLCPFGWCVILVGHFPQESPDWNLKIGFPLSPPPNHAFLPLTHDLTASCIGWVQAGEVWALRVSSFHMCPKSAYCSLIRRGLQACPHSLPSVFWPFLCELLFYFLPPLGAGLFVTGLYISFGPFLDCPISCHITLSFLL